MLLVLVVAPEPGNENVEVAVAIHVRNSRPGAKAATTLHLPPWPTRNSCCGVREPSFLGHIGVERGSARTVDRGSFEGALLTPESEHMVCRAERA